MDPVQRRIMKYIQWPKYKGDTSLSTFFVPIKTLCLANRNFSSSWRKNISGLIFLNLRTRQVQGWEQFCEEGQYACA